VREAWVPSEKILPPCEGAVPSRAWKGAFDPASKPSPHGLAHLREEILINGLHPREKDAPLIR